MANINQTTHDIEEQIQLLEEEKKNYNLLIDKHISLIKYQLDSRGAVGARGQIRFAKYALRDYHVSAGEAAFYNPV